MMLKATKLKSIRSTFVAAIVLGAASSAPALSATFDLDGVFSPTDAYTHQILLPLTRDNGDPLGETTLLFGVGANSDGATGGPGDLFVYVDVPLDLKDNTWGSGTFGATTDQPGYLDGEGNTEDGKIPFNMNTGSENIEFKWKTDASDDGDKVKIKLSSRDPSQKDDEAAIQACSDAGTCIGHELKSNENGGGAVLAARTSLDFIMANFNGVLNENLQLWGSQDKDDNFTSNSPTLKQDGDGNDIHEALDPAFADWPFKQSWEFQIDGGTGFSIEEAIALVTLNFIDGNRNSDAEDNLFFLHASPIKNGGKVDIIINCEDINDVNCLPTEITQVPVPASLPLLAAALGGFGLLRLRRTRAS